MPVDVRRVALRPFEPSDQAAVLAGRDDEWKRWLGPGHERPRPTYCIVVDGEVVGWVDSDPDSPRLVKGQTNVGYSVFPLQRGKGYATRALLLLLQQLMSDPAIHAATMSIDPRNTASIRVAEKAGFALVTEGEEAHSFEVTTSSRRT
jgi:RimJ/RimL family protein N-acetyltransferase